MIYEVPLSIVRPPLSLNQRMHWATRNRFVHELRHEAALRARQVKLPVFEVPVIVRFHYAPPTVRGRDKDNLFATLKPLIDGLVDSGCLARGDTGEWVEPRIMIHPKEKAGRCWLTVEPLDNTQ